MSSIESAGDVTIRPARDWEELRAPENVGLADLTAVRWDRVPVAVFVPALPSSALFDAVTSVPRVETSVTCAADVVIVSVFYPAPVPAPFLS